MEKDHELGLDIGTSSIKLIVANNMTGELLLELNQSTETARIESDDRLRSEQNVEIIINLVQKTFDRIPAELLVRLRAVQICGQMHGVVLWNSKTKKHSNLVTWQGMNLHSFAATQPSIPTNIATPKTLDAPIVFSIHYQSSRCQTLKQATEMQHCFGTVLMKQHILTAMIRPVQFRIL